MYFAEIPNDIPKIPENIGDSNDDVFIPGTFTTGQMVLTVGSSGGRHGGR